MLWLLILASVTVSEVLLVMILAAFWLKEQQHQRLLEQARLAHEDSFHRDQTLLQLDWTQTAETQQRKQAENRTACVLLSKQLRYVVAQLQLPEAEVDVHTVGRVIDQLQQELPTLLELTGDYFSYRHRRALEDSLARVVEEFTIRMNS